MTDDPITPKSFIPVDRQHSADSTAKQPATDLKDYFCPFCGHKLFRGNVNEFRMVCQECNRLVDSNKIEETPVKKDEKKE